MIDYAAVLTEYFPGEPWSLQGIEYEGLVWHNDSEKPTKEQLDGLWNELLQRWESEKADKEKRAAQVKTKLEALGLSLEDIRMTLGE